jgi:hypothetical protein
MPNTWRTANQSACTTRVAQASVLLAQVNALARIVKPRGMTTMLVPGTGTTTRTSPSARTLKPAIARNEVSRGDRDRGVVEIEVRALDRVAGPRFLLDVDIGLDQLAAGSGVRRR